MTRQLFGTDGIRGKANSEPMTPETALRVAMAAGQVLRRGDRRHLVVIGKDTRLFRLYARARAHRGLRGAGHGRGAGRAAADARDRHARRARCAPILASWSPPPHNPYEDNGIKLFAAPTATSSPTTSRRRSRLVVVPEPSRAPSRRISAGPSASTMPAVATSSSSKRASRGAAARRPADRGRLRPRRRLQGRADGALGIRSRGLRPWGVARAAQHQPGLRGAVPRADAARGARARADIGIALDGDADRLIIADERGAFLDGDQLMALIATGLAGTRAARGRGAGGDRDVQPRSRAVSRRPGIVRACTGPRSATATSSDAQTSAATSASRRAISSSPIMRRPVTA